jgi:type II secretory pathway predicted ATPase ExeA
MQLSYEFYGLREQPFGVTPDPRFYYPSAAHREVGASLACGLEHDAGFAALISDPGMGKTMLLFRFLESLAPSLPTAFVFNTQCTAHDLLRNLLDELDIPSVDQDFFRMHNELKLFLIRQSKPVLVIIDEAHNLTDEVLETVRLLSDFEAPDHKLLHIVLAGQRQLADRLQHPLLLQLVQRITIINKLAPLSPEETSNYVDHRLTIAGYNGGKLFSSDALAKIARHSRGVPRSINRICFNSILLGCALNKKVLGSEIIDDVMADLELTLSPEAEIALPAHWISKASVPEPTTRNSNVQYRQHPDHSSVNLARRPDEGIFNLPTPNTGVRNTKHEPRFNASWQPPSAPTQAVPRPVAASKSLPRPNAGVRQTGKRGVTSTTLLVLMMILLDAILGAVLLVRHFRSSSTGRKVQSQFVESPLRCQNIPATNRTAEVSLSVSGN